MTAECLNGHVRVPPSDPQIQRPWTVITAVMTAAHHTFELSSGVGLVGQPELGLVGAGALWGAQLPTWIALATRGGNRWDRLLAVWSGAAFGGVVVHYALWPWKRGRLGLPELTEAEGMSPRTIPAYNLLLQVWGAAALMSVARDIPRRDRRWALVGLALFPLMRKGATHHFNWVAAQTETNPAWWNRAVQPRPAGS